MGDQNMSQLYGVDDGDDILDDLKVLQQRVQAINATQELSTKDRASIRMLQVFNQRLQRLTGAEGISKELFDQIEAMGSQAHRPILEGIRQLIKVVMDHRMHQTGQLTNARSRKKLQTLRLADQQLQDIFQGKANINI